MVRTASIDMRQVRLSTLIGRIQVTVLNEAVLVVIGPDGTHQRFNLPTSDSARPQAWEKSASPQSPLINPESANDPRFPDVVYPAAPDRVVALIGVASHAVLLSTRGWADLIPYLTRFNLKTQAFETRALPLGMYLNVIAAPSNDLVLCTANGPAVRVPW